MLHGKSRDICAGDITIADLKKTQHSLSITGEEKSLLQVARQYCDKRTVKYAPAAGIWVSAV